MALPTLEGRTPTSIRAVLIHLSSAMEEVGEPPVLTDVRRATFTLVPVDQNGVDMQAINGDLPPHLTPEQIAQVQAFGDVVRALAEAALPTP